MIAVHLVDQANKNNGLNTIANTLPIGCRQIHLFNKPCMLLVFSLSIILLLDKPTASHLSHRKYQMLCSNQQHLTPFHYKIVSFLLILFFSMTASAERADRDKPIHLEADQATVEDYKRQGEFRTSIFTGNVILTQGTLLVKADKVIMKEDITGYRHATAYGNLVSYREKRDGTDEYIEAWGKRVEYSDKTDTIELFESARLKRGQDEVRGDYISYNITRDFFQVIGQPQQKNTKKSTDTDHRVRAVIQPKKKQPEQSENSTEN